MKNQGLVVALSLLLLSISCSKDESSNSTSSNTMLSTYSSVVNQVAEVSDLLDTSYRSNAFVQELTSTNYLMDPAAPPVFNDDWGVTTNLPDDVVDGNSVTAKEWMGHQLDPALLNSNGSAVNVFGRLNNALGIFCALGVGSAASGQAIDGNGYLSAGTSTLTFTASVKASMLTTCGIDASGFPDGTEGTVTTEVVSGDYDRKYTFSFLQQTYLVKNSGGIINITSAETQESGAVSRTIVNWDQNTGITKVEYVSNPGTATPGTSGLYAYRMFYDETADEAQILTYEGNEDGSNYKRYILAGKPQAGDAFSLSMKTTHIASAALLEGCVNASSGNMVASGDGVRCTPSATRTAGADISLLNTIFTNFIAQNAQTGWGTATSATALAWTNKTNMLTTPISYNGI